MAEFISEKNNVKEYSKSINSNLSNTLSEIGKVLSSLETKNNFELNVYQNSSVGDGIQANNPWLQEMPDPISKVCWDNYISINPKDARGFNITNDPNTMSASIINLTIDSKTHEIPVIVQPGQAEGTIGLAMGYGRKLAGPVGDNVGFNAFDLLNKSSLYQNLTVSEIKLSPLIKSTKLRKHKHMRQ